MDYVYGKNGNRVSAMNDLWYGKMKEQIDSMNLPSEEAKLKMAFKLTAEAVLDMLGDAMDPEDAPEIMSDLDLFMGVMLTNQRFGVDLMKEQNKYLMSVDRSKFKDDEEYVRALSDFEDDWWDLPQPPLDGRTPADAIRESLAKYGLKEE